MNLKDNHYIVLNREGIFPGPHETEEEFLQRVALIQTKPPLHVPDLEGQDWQKANILSHRLFDIQPTWVPAFYSNKGLSFWEAAAVWDCEGRTVVQLRSQLAKGKWVFVQQQEVLAHEAAHAARMTFRESRFEEILCYQTSQFAWRRRLGPLFRHPWEAALCAGAAAIGCLFSLFGAYSAALIVPWIPFVFFLFRLARDYAVFQRCLAHLRPLLAHPDQALAVALRLTDKEMALFARTSPEAITAYAAEQSAQHLRWRILCDAYFNLG